jgi:hypothetical protein
VASFTPDQSQRIIKALSERVPSLGPCPVCRDGKATWTLANGIISLPVTSVSPTYPDIWGAVGGVQEAIPAYGLVCSKCGHIQLLSAAALGNPHLLQFEDFGLRPTLK